MDTSGLRAGFLLLAAVPALIGCQVQRASEPGLAPRPAETTAATSGVGPEPTAWALHLPFDDPDALGNAGTLPVRVKVVTFGSGEVRADQSPHGGALMLPAQAARKPGFAILSVVPRNAAIDQLSPDGHDFSFGADFSIDNKSTGTARDDGDNLIQRGLFEGAAQYKIQVDHGLLSCRIAGLSGEVIVKASHRVQPEHWYRARCTKRGASVTLEVAEMDGGGRRDWVEVSRTGSIGDVVMSRSTPLSVGGKLAPDGTMFPASTDQFNGSVDRVVYRLLG